MDSNLTFELGSALYWGWATMVTALWSAILLIVYDDHWWQNSLTAANTREIDKVGILDGVSGVYREHGSISGSFTRHNGTNDSLPDITTSQSTLSNPSTGSMHARRLREKTNMINRRSPMSDLRTLSYNTNTDSNTMSTSDELQTKLGWNDTTSTKSIQFLITTHL